MNDNPVVDPVANGIDQSNGSDEAFAAFADARAEFFKGVPSVYTKKKLSVKEIMDTLTPPAGYDSVAWDAYVIHESNEVREVSLEEFDVAEKVTALAWEAKVTGDNSEINAYLKETGLYDKFQHILQKYNLEQHAKNLNLRKKSVPENFFKSNGFRDGDIFLKHKPDLMDAIIPGHYGHAAFLDVEQRTREPNFFLLSASSDTDQKKGLAKGRVGYDRLVEYWTESKEVSVNRVTGSTQTMGTAAIVSARKHIGKPFNILAGRGSNDDFYCSKVVYRGWKDATGIDIEQEQGWLKYLEFWRWNKSKLIPYPEFKWVYSPDPWVLPSELKSSTLTQQVAEYK
jgi:hypothetical protein